MLTTKKNMSIAAMVCIGLASVVFSCSRRLMPPTGPSTNTTINIGITNPEWGTPIGFPGNPNQEYYPGYDITVTVNKVNANNQAVFYSKKNITYTHPQNAASQAAQFYVNGVDIPTTGSYLIIYQLNSRNCTWPNTQPACTSPTGGASLKVFRDQHLFVSGTPGSYLFVCDILNKISEVCC